MADSEIAGLTEDTTPDSTDNVYVQDAAGAVDKRVPLSALPVSTAAQTALDAKVAKAGDTMTGTLAMAADQDITLTSTASATASRVTATHAASGATTTLNAAGVEAAIGATATGLGYNGITAYGSTADYAEMAQGTLQLIRASAAQGQLLLTVARDVGAGTVDLWQWHADGVAYLGDAQDVNLYRGGADQLKTDDQFSAASLIVTTDDAYAAGWDGSLGIPTKNALFDKIESLQPLDSDLSAIAALTTTAFGRSVLAAADAAALRTLAALGTIATQAASSVAITGGTITGITDLAVADGGTGSSTAVDALTALTAPAQTAATTNLAPTADPALARLQRAWSSRATSPVKVMWIGDSQIAFSRINVPFSTAMSDAVNPPNRRLSNPYPALGTVVPGDGNFGVGGSAAVWTSTTGVVQADKVANRGISGDAIALANLDDLTSPSMTFDSITFYWLTPLSGSGATFDFYLDGVLTAPNTGISAAAAGSHTITTTAGSHTVKIVSNGVTLFDFVQVYYGNQSAYFQPWAAARSGITTSGITGWTDLATYLASVSPDLVLLESGTNDASFTGYYNDSSTLIDTIRANCSASIAITLPNATLGDTNWADWRTAAMRLADIKRCALVDLSEAIPDLSVSDPLGYTSDGVHYTTMGRNVFAGAVITSLFGGAIRDRRGASAFDIGAGPTRDRRSYASDFEELEAALVVASGANQRIPGTPFTVSMLGTASTATQVGGTDLLPGVVDLATGTAASGFCGVFAGGGNAQLFSTTRRFDFYARIKTPTLTTGAQLFVVRAGTMAGMTTGVAPTEGLYFEAPADGTNWLAISGQQQAAQAAQAWTRVTTTATFTVTSHGMVTGDAITVSVTSDAAAIPLGFYTVTVLTANTFTIVCLNAGAASGTATVLRSIYTKVDTTRAQTTSYQVAAINYDEQAGVAYFRMATALQNSLLVASISTNLPSVVSVGGTHAGASILKTAGTTSRSFRCDEMALDVYDNRALRSFGA